VFDRAPLTCFNTFFVPGVEFIRCCRKLRGLLAAHQAGEVAVDEVVASVQGWVNHTRYGNTTGLRKAVFAQAKILTADGQFSGGEL
jgi:hypothetical protein